jgi:hypothetical protein
MQGNTLIKTMFSRIHRAVSAPRSVDTITKQFNDMQTELNLHADRHLKEAARHKEVHEAAAVAHDKSVAEAARARVIANRINGMVT